MSTTMLIVHHSGTLAAALKAAGTLIACSAGCDRVTLISDSADEHATLSETYRRGGLSVQTMILPDLVAGLNRCVRKARQQGGSVLVVHESDTLVDHSAWIETRVAPLVTFAAVAPAGPGMRWSQRVNPPDSVLLQGTQAVIAWQRQHRGKVGPADALSPACLSLSLDTFDRVGELDEAMSWAWAWRDFWARLHLQAWRRPIVALGVYAATPERPPVLLADCAHGRLLYYDRHATITSNDRVCGILVVQPQSRIQFELLCRSVEESVVDGWALVLIGDTAPFEAESDELDRLLARIDILLDPEGTTVTALENQAAAATAEAGYGWAIRLQEGETVRGIDRRALRHPDPLVYSYNLSIRTAWGSPTIVRTDKPYGDGGDNTDLAARSNDRRLFRPLGHHRYGADGCRVIAQAQILNHYFVADQTATQGPFQGEIFHDRRQLGVHMLCYADTRLDDVGRWLDWTQGLASRVVLCWTSEEPPPDLLRDLAERHGATVVHGYTGDRVDFAAWRNRALEPLVYDGLEVALFVDPDEWLDDPLELIPVRRMLDRPDVPGWLFEAHNWRPDGWSQSFAVRLHRIGDDIRFRGRVHESLTDDLSPLGVIRQAPIRLYNRGSYGAADKAGRYLEIIREQLAEDPASSLHWITLGWSYRNAGHVDAAIECLDRAVAHAPEKAYLAAIERATIRLQQAIPDLRYALERIPDDNPRRPVIARWAQAIDDLAMIPVAEDSPPPLPGETDGLQGVRGSALGAAIDTRHEGDRQEA